MPFMDAELSKEVSCVGLSVDKPIAPQLILRFSCKTKEKLALHSPKSFSQWFEVTVFQWKALSWDSEDEKKK